jgi:hypothetical protein
VLFVESETWQGFSDIVILIKCSQQDTTTGAMRPELTESGKNGFLLKLHLLRKTLASNFLISGSRKVGRLKKIRDLGHFFMT